MRRLIIVLTAGSLLGTAAGCHTCNCGGNGDMVADHGDGHETLAGIVAHNWQPAYVNPAAPEATTPEAVQALDESENLPQPRRMPTGEPTISDVQPAQ